MSFSLIKYKFLSYKQGNQVSMYEHLVTAKTGENIMFNGGNKSYTDLIPSNQKFFICVKGDPMQDDNFSIQINVTTQKTAEIINN